MLEGWLGSIDVSTSASISAIGTAVSAFTSIAVAALTVLLFLENRRLRKAGTEPEMVAYLIPHPDGHGGINFVLENVGSGPAFEIEFKLKYDIADFENHEVLVLNDELRTPLSVLPHGQKISALFGISFVLYGSKLESKEILKPFHVEFSYKNSRGKRRKTSRKIDISQFAGLRGILAKPAIRDAADSLKSIESHLGTIARQSRRFSAFVDISQFEDEYRKVAKGEERSTE